MRLLVDADDVIFAWGERYDISLNRRQAAAQAAGDIETTLAIGGIPRSAEHRTWDLFDGMQREQRAIINEVLAEPGFYAELRPFGSSIQAVKQMLAAGHEVHIVTSPMSSNRTCASDKLASIERYLGFWMRRRTIITDDKTVVHGDVLFDDRANIVGSMTPTWTQVLVDAPHNRGDRPDLLRIPRLRFWRSALEQIGASK